MGFGGVGGVPSYAHHPQEIKGDLQAARSLAGDGGRVLVAFQPHLVSRTQAFGVEMGQELGAADAIVVMDIYLAREDAIAGVSGAMIVEACPLPAERKVFEPSWAATAGHLVGLAAPGDVMLTLGAGDVTLLGPEILDQLRLGTGADQDPNA